MSGNKDRSPPLHQAAVLKPPKEALDATPLVVQAEPLELRVNLVTVQLRVGQVQHRRLLRVPLHDDRRFSSGCAKARSQPVD